jgi:hypothetical protein
VRSTVTATSTATRPGGDHGDDPQGHERDHLQPQPWWRYSAGLRGAASQVSL